MCIYMRKILIDVLVLKYRHFILGLSILEKHNAVAFCPDFGFKWRNFKIDQDDY